jgi:hypothetical protein
MGEWRCTKPNYSDIHTVGFLNIISIQSVISVQYLYDYAFCVNPRDDTFNGTMIAGIFRLDAFRFDQCQTDPSVITSTQISLTGVVFEYFKPGEQAVHGSNH